MKLPAQRFSGLFKTGQKASFNREIALFYKENSLSANRFGIVVPKKLVKLSTKRNKSKRCLKEAIRLNSGKIKAGFDIIVYSYKYIDSLKDSESLLFSVLSKAKLLI